MILDVWDNFKLAANVGGPFCHSISMKCACSAPAIGGLDGSNRKGLFGAIVRTDLCSKFSTND